MGGKREEGEEGEEGEEEEEGGRRKREQRVVASNRKREAGTVGRGNRGKRKEREAGRGTVDGQAEQNGDGVIDYMDPCWAVRSSVFKGFWVLRALGF